MDEAIVRAIIHAESAYNPNALSRVGAQGLMQLMPATARRFGVGDAFDASQNISGGVQYLAWLLKRFNGDLTLAAAGYNAGEGAVDKYRRRAAVQRDPPLRRARVGRWPTATAAPSPAARWPPSNPPPARPARAPGDDTIVGRLSVPLHFAVFVGRLPRVAARRPASASIQRLMRSAGWPMLE